RPITLALPEHRDPRQPRLRALEDQQLEEGPVVVLGHAPFRIVVGHVEWIATRPTAAFLDREDHASPHAALGVALPGQATRCGMVLGCAPCRSHIPSADHATEVAMGKTREFHDGRSDGLVPLESLDLDRVTSFSGLLRAMSRTAFGGRALGEAFDVTLAMVKDPDCKIVLTLSGAMTIAKMGKVISRMIDAGMVHAIVSTGALMAHGLSEAVGMVHYRHDPRMSDEDLFAKGYNRVFDTLEMEANLNYVEEFTSRALDTLDGEQELSSEIVCRALGRVLAEDPHGQGVLRSAYVKG